MKTYARSIRRIWDGEDVAVAKRQRIEQKKPPVMNNSTAAPTPGTSDENMQRAIRETSVAVSSSPSRKNSAIFSGSDAHTDETVDTATPPSSPPPVPQVTPPANITRKPTFNFLKRKRDATNGTREESEPLTEVVNNSSSIRAPTTASAPTPAPAPAPHPQQEQPPRPKPQQPPERKQSHSKQAQPRPSFPSLEKKPVLTQMTLDLGAETRKTCRECGMEYVTSNPDDVAMHRMWHDKDDGGVDLGKAFQKGSAMRWAYEVPHIEGIVVVVDRKTSTPARLQVKKALDVVGRELSSVPITEEVLWSQKSLINKGAINGKGVKQSDAEERNDHRSDRYKVFLHIKDGKCVGLCLAERITEGRPVKASEQKEVNGNAAAPSSSITVHGTSRPAVVGISRIWVSKTFRRKGVATNLLDCVMNHFIYGMEIDKEEVAFSQPTESGGQLARAWFGDASGWLVYNED